MLFLLSTVALLVGLIAYESRRKKQRPGELPLVNSSAIVDTPLNPTGSVLVDGELFMAQAVDGRFLPTNTRVTVVGVSKHLLLVTEPAKRLL